MPAEPIRFTPDHVWIQAEGAIARVGVTAYLADQLDEILLVDLPPTGRHVRAGDPLAVLENPDRSFIVRAPVDGYVLEVNEAAADAPELINAAPEFGGWLAKLKIEEPLQIGRLLDRAGYEDLLARL